MKTMTAAEAKNSFGKLLDATMREPVLITKNDRPVAVTLSMADLKDIAQSGADESGSDALERLIERSRIHKRIAAAQSQVAGGLTEPMNDRFFDTLRARVNK